MKKKIIQLTMILGVLLTGGLEVSAATDKGEAPFIINGHSVVPVDEVLYVFNIDYTWDAATETIYMEKDGHNVELKIGENEMTVNGVKQALPTAAIVVDEQPYIPIRVIGEAFDLLVNWDAEQNTILIQTPTLRTGMTIYAPDAVVMSWQGHGK